MAYNLNLDEAAALIKPTYPAGSRSEESLSSKRLIKNLNMEPLGEGGYYVVTDNNPHTVPNPFQNDTKPEDKTRLASTEIFYLLTPYSPQGYFHRNKARIHHLLHKGKARYVVIHADEWQLYNYARVETFVVGQNIEDGEKLQLMVEGMKYKASYLIDAEEGTPSSSLEGPGCLISEVVVPGFDFSDHDFLTHERLFELVGPEMGTKLEWLLKLKDNMQ